MKAGLLCNPLSGRVRKQKQPEPAAFALSRRVSYREASTPEAIAAALDSLLGEAPDILAVAGGDGTVQAVLTCLFNHHGDKSWPLLCLVPAGTTNMTALDLGVRGSPRRVLKRLADSVGKTDLSASVQRPVLRIERTGEPDIYGMFFGAGSIASGVRYFHERISHLGMTSEFAGGLVLTWLLLGLLTGRTRNSLLPAHAAITTPDGKSREGSHMIILASALDRLLLGMRPYWGREPEPIHATLVKASPPRFWRSLPRLLTGRGERLTAIGGYESFNTSTLTLLMDGEFIIDGELHAAARSNGPVRISSTGPVSFLVP